METVYGLLIGALFCFAIASGATTKDGTSRSLEDAQLSYLAKWSAIAELYRTDPDVAQGIDYIRWYQQEMAKGNLVDTRPPPIDIPSIPFTCNPDLGVSPTPPTSVHQLRPGDIDVMAAFGDSITAGNGVDAFHALLVVIQNRGESWSVGGDFSLELNVSTIPNMLRKFNPNVMGHSDCNSVVSDFEYSWFNVAVPGGIAEDMPAQAEDMVAKMKTDTRLKYADDWKMVTLFIGGNDLCGYCNNKERYSTENYKLHIQTALDILHAQVPRVFVNLVPMSDVGFINDVTFHYNGTSYPGEPENPFGFYPDVCETFHSSFCDCVTTEAKRAETKQAQMDYFAALQELVDSGRYDTKDDFTVVLQPHLRDAVGVEDPNTGLTDNRYFAPDCFHPNRRLHQILAYALWNTMLTPVGMKPTGSDFSMWDGYICPTEASPYLSTKVNSLPDPQPTTGAATHLFVTMATLVTVVAAAFVL